MSIVEQFVANNERYASSFQGPLPLPPAKQIAVVACMDARFSVYGALGLKEGDAHVIRNAGGLVDDMTMRSLVISQRLLGTRTIVLIHHSDCGMLTFTDDELRRALIDDVGFAPSYAFGAFKDLEEDLRAAAERIRHDPFLLHRDDVHGFVIDVASGKLQPVDLSAPQKVGSRA
ncbi:MAG: carbonic anhydrase [Candidatus Eremiobacteraeota bacterium]|nr:carbonic anhydrase [Candidatus Eremiobacteraeota bacterium]